MATRAHTPPRDLTRFLPNGKAIAIAFGIVCVAAGAYAIARETSLFAVREVRVHGAPPGIAERVRSAVEPFMGKSLVSLDGGAVVRTVEALPVVASASYDRSFPNTLTLRVVPEQPALVLRRGLESWLVSARGRVMRRLADRESPELARMWVAQDLRVAPGGFVQGDPAQALAAILPIRATPFAHQIRTVRPLPDNMTLVLRSGLKLRLGDMRALRLKLAVAQTLVAEVGHVSGYADLSVPGRPVVSLNSQPEG